MSLPLICLDISIEELVGKWKVSKMQRWIDVTCVRISDTQLNCTFADIGDFVVTWDGAIVTFADGMKGTYTGNGVIIWPDGNWIKKGKRNIVYQN